MQVQPHHRLGLGFLKFGIQCILHFLIYFYIHILTTMRYYTEVLCEKLDHALHWNDHNTGLIYIWPWYYRLLHHFIVWFWHFLNFLMQTCERLHPWLCDPDTFILPDITYYALDFDFNNN